MEQVKKVLIIGSKGMAGHIMFEFFNADPKFTVVDIARGVDFHTPSYQLDVTDFDALTDVLRIEKPDYVINCIGVLNRDAEDNPDKAILLNSYFPHFLARNGAQIGFKVIHISTDCVFNGKKGGYTEDSVKDGTGFYAQTKAMGEINYGNNLTLRTSIIGPELKENGIGLFHWFMNQKGVIKGYRNAFWSGVTTVELAKAVKEAMNQDLVGLHHLVNGEKINKYELTSIFKNVFGMNEISIEPFDDYKVDKSLVDTQHIFQYTVPTYQIMVEEMKSWINSHSEMYSHYSVK